jgi:hypothetical protein
VLDSGHTSEYDELSDILNILSKHSYTACCIQGSVILALSHSEPFSDARALKEASVERDLKRNYFSLYGKVKIDSMGLSIVDLLKC